MTTTPPNPAAAAVEKIIEGCYDKIYRDGHEYTRNGEYVMRWKLSGPIIHRAVRDAIAATGAREALEKFDDESALMNSDEDFVDLQMTNGSYDGLYQALANLAAVCGKEMK